MHFCVFAARLNGRVPVPRNTSLNWFMPALVNSSVGSSSGTTLDDGTKVWPRFLTKKSMNCWRISFDVGMTLSVSQLVSRDASLRAERGGVSRAPLEDSRRG